MPQRRRAQDTAAPVWLIAAAATSVVGGVAWAWYNLRGAAPVQPDTRPPPPVGKTKRTGPKPPLSLATPVLPPTWLISRISEAYELHLIFPSHAPFPPPPQYTPTAFDSRRLLFHESGEGLIHLTRVVGGILVKVTRGMDGDALPAEAGDVEEVDAVRLERDTKAFVREFILVDPTGISAKVEGQSAKSWEDLAHLLSV